MYVYTVYTRPLSVQAQYSRSCPIINCSCYNGSLLTSTVVCLTAAKFKPTNRLPLYRRGTDQCIQSTYIVEVILVTITITTDTTTPPLHHHLPISFDVECLV
jgi:hypothetical protein